MFMSRPQLFLIFVLVLCSWAAADVLKLADGREFEGTVLSQSKDQVQFDTVISGIRAKLSFKPGDVTALEKKALPAGFFDAAEPDPAAAAGESAGPMLYLEIPIVGRFRETVFVQAIRSSLARAKLQKVTHIVFTVDSPGGAVDDAGAIYRTLTQFEKDFTYHAIVKSCVGDALVIPFLCQTIHLQPGATVGGTDKWDKRPRRYAAKEEQVARAQIAEDLAEEAQRRGRKGDIIRAMVDPADSLAAWQDPGGEVVMGRTPPASLPPDKLIFDCKPGSVLVLSFEQATKLGIPTLDGGPEKLGAVLGLRDWREASSYGRDTMNRAAAAQRTRASTTQAKFENDVAANVRLRDTTRRAIEQNLKQAATWNPTDASYKTLAYAPLYWNPTVTWDTRIWTPESRQRWKDRTEACLYYLNRTRASLESMIRLDKQAVTLGLSPTFKSGELQAMLEDVSVKIEALKRNQNRTGE